MMLWSGIIAALILGLALFLERKPMAELQSLTIGGRLTPGCVVAQALFFLALALLGVVAWLAGWIR